jgi:hypothetical protein
MLKLPFVDSDMKSISDIDHDISKQRQQRHQQQDPAFKEMKIFGARYNHDDDCMNQANFVALAMERKRRRKTEDMIHQAAAQLTELFHPSPTSIRHKGKLSSIMDVLELQQCRDDTASVSTSCSEYSKRTSEIEIKDYETTITSRESWQSLQNFADVLKSEAMIRQMQR